MSKDVRRLFAAQKAAKAASSPVSTGSGTSSLSSTGRRVTHPLAKYDPKSLRLTCAICGPAVPIRSDSLWNAHLVSKPHQEAVAKLRAVKEQMQRKEAEAAERQRLQQQQQQQQQLQKQSQQQGVKRKATGGLVAYADDSESENDSDDVQGSHTNNIASTVSDTKRLKIDSETVVEHDRSQMEQEIEDEEDAMAGLPAGFFDASDTTSSSNMDPVTRMNGSPAPVQEGLQKVEGGEDAMEGVLPSGFFDDPEQDARIRAEVGGATTDLQQRQVDAEFKALQADLARDFERHEQQEAALRAGQVLQTPTSAPQGAQATKEHIPYEEKVELEEQEVEESILARSEEEYLLFVEMQERLEALREKKERLVAPRSSAASSSTPSLATHPVASSSSSTAARTPTIDKPRKQKSKSILELVREQEKAKREKERLAAEAFARLSTADGGDRRMAGDGDESDDDDEDDEDIEAMMDWRARRV
ncbi:hypothetical protein EC968_003868 [Mortierella alpina]|nr:hypothetical protein EC968_003868 [Mortierella alpina]